MIHIHNILIPVLTQQLAQLLLNIKVIPSLSLLILLLQNLIINTSILFITNIFRPIPTSTLLFITVHLLIPITISMAIPILITIYVAIPITIHFLIHIIVHIVILIIIRIAIPINIRASIDLK